MGYFILSAQKMVVIHRASCSSRIHNLQFFYYTTTQNKPDHVNQMTIQKWMNTLSLSNEQTPQFDTNLANITAYHDMLMLYNFSKIHCTKDVI